MAEDGYSDMKDRFPVSLKNPHYGGISAFVFGLAVHFFALVNITHNYDSIATPSGYGAGVTSGRWFLEILGKITSKLLVGSYNLTWFNGIVFLLLIAAAVYFLVSVLEIRSRLLAVVTGMAFVSFPTAASMLFFRFTATYYAIALLFAVLAAWVLKNWKYGLIPSVLLTACGLGIYQAYMPITVAVFVLVLLRQTLSGEEKIRTLFVRGVYYCASIVLGLLAYFAAMKLALAMAGTQLDTYQGMDQMGKLNLAQLPGMVVNTFLSFFTAPRSRYDIVQNTLMELLYGLALTGSGAMILYILAARIRKAQWVLFAAFLCIAFPVAVNLIMIMSADSFIYTLMLYPFAMVLVLPLVVLDVLLEKPLKPECLGKWCRKAVVLVVAALIFCNTYFTNLNYQMQYYTTRQTENYMTGLITQVRMAEGFCPEKKWAFLGNIQDPLLDSYWSELSEHFGYGGNADISRLFQSYSWKSWIDSYVGYNIPAAGEEELAAIWQWEEVGSMPCWPSAGSIRVIDEYVVIKFQEP